MSEAPEAYEANAQDYLYAREQSNTGSNEVANWCRTLREGATIIDLACGGGYPITSALKKSQLHIWAVDSSTTLVKVFQSRFPQIPIQCARVQNFDFFNLKFDAAIAIGLMFLLSEADQINLIASVSKQLNPGGRFLFTAPTRITTWDDISTGTLSRSLGKARYEEILNIAGFCNLSCFTDSGENNYFDAEIATV